MKQTLGIVAIASALAIAPAFAQTAGGQSTPKPKASSSKSAGQSTMKSGAGDTAFAKEAAVGGMAEVELGNLAKEKAADADVKQFGDRMVTDHSKANDELKQWAQQKSITLPTTLDAKHTATRDRLSKLSGAAFDKAYMREMLTDHQHDVAAFTKESKSGTDADLKSWAAKTLPTLQDHLKMAQTTASKVGAGTAAAKSKTGASKGQK
jgi:putative membrane protein